MNKPVIITALLTLAIGAGGGYWYGQRTTPQSASSVASGAAGAVPERKPLFYRNPMNPEITSPVPAQDSMGMDYIPVYADEGSGPSGTVRIDPVTEQNIGVRSARVERRTIGHTLRAVGRVDYDEELLTRLNPKTEGWVEQLMVSNTGEQVKRDDILLGIYSPKLVTAQEEYLLALQNRSALEKSPYEELRRNAERLVDAARTRLELLDMPAHQLRELEQSGQVMKTLHIHSPFDGVVVNVGARPGQYVTPATELYQIADLSRLWVYVDLYENELPWVHVGDQARMEVNGVPGHAFSGRVKYIYPSVDPVTRTARLRLEFPNHKGLLKPEMFAEVTLQASARHDVLAVPSEAVVRSGAREQLFVVRAPGRFEPREVQLGVSSEGWTEIRKGVTAGEQVVTSAQFLIDSESKLREAADKMREAAPVAPDLSGMEMDGMDMGEMDMDDMKMDDMEMDGMRLDDQGGVKP